MHFHFCIVLLDCGCDVIFTWKWGWKPTKWRRPFCSNSWFWDKISKKPFGALRSVMAHFFCICYPLSIELNLFLDRRFPLKSSSSILTIQKSTNVWKISVQTDSRNKWKRNREVYIIRILTPQHHKLLVCKTAVQLSDSNSSVCLHTVPHLLGAVIKNVTDWGGRDFVGVWNHFLKICWGMKKFL